MGKGREIRVRGRGGVELAEPESLELLRELGLDEDEIFFALMVSDGYDGKQAMTAIFPKLAADGGKQKAARWRGRERISMAITLLKRQRIVRYEEGRNRIRNRLLELGEGMISERLLEMTIGGGTIREVRQLTEEERSMIQEIEVHRGKGKGLDETRVKIKLVDRMKALDLWDRKNAHLKKEQMVIDIEKSEKNTWYRQLGEKLRKNRRYAGKPTGGGDAETQ